MVLPADKGRATVILKNEDYEAKMTSLLNISEYQIINHDPTSTINRKTSQKMNELQQRGCIERKTRLQMLGLDYHAMKTVFSALLQEIVEKR